MFHTNLKVMFVVNGMELRSRNTSEVTKQISLHDTDGSMLCSYPLTSELCSFSGIECCMMELTKHLGKVNKLICKKESKEIELCIHWSKEYNEHRVTFNKPASKYKPSTAYESTFEDSLNTAAQVITNLTGINLEYTKQIVSKLKLLVSTKRMDNNW